MANVASYYNIWMVAQRPGEVGLCNKTTKLLSVVDSRDEVMDTVPPARSEVDADERYVIQSMARGLQVMTLFTEQRPALRLTEICEITGVKMPTAFRIAATLVHCGFLQRSSNGDYRPSPGVLRMGTSALRSIGLVELATSQLQDLAEEYGQTANMAVLHGDKVLYLIRRRARVGVRENVQVGTMLPAVHTANGKALLAGLEDKQIEALLTPASFKNATGPNAIATLEELRSEIAAVRRNGYAIQHEQVTAGTRSVASAVRSTDGKTIASVSIAVNAYSWSLEQTITELAPRIKTFAESLSGLYDEL